jgi:hypothetical protein
MPNGVPHPMITEAVTKIVDAIDNREAVVPNKVDFVEFMMSLSGNAAEMDGTAVSADELWSLPEVESAPVAKAKEVLAGIPNGGAVDHRYLESEDDSKGLLGPTIISVGGGAVPAGAWER